MTFSRELVVLHTTPSMFGMFLSTHCKRKENIIEIVCKTTSGHHRDQLPAEIPIELQDNSNSTRIVKMAMIYSPAVASTFNTKLFFPFHTLNQARILLKPPHSHPCITCVHIFFWWCVITICNNLSVTYAFTFYFTHKVWIWQLEIVPLLEASWISRIHTAHR